MAQLHLHADAAELALSIGLDLPVYLGRHEHRVGIQRAHHALQGAVDQLGVVHGLDIVILHLGQHLGEDIQLAVGRVTFGPGAGRLQQHKRGQGSREASGEQGERTWLEHKDDLLLKPNTKRPRQLAFSPRQLAISH